MLVLKEVKNGQKLISRDDSNPPCAIILTGKFQFITKGGDQSEIEGNNIIEAGGVCGNFAAFNGKRWKPGDIISLEDCSTAAVFETAGLQKLLAAENSNIQFKALLAFLTESIPRFDNLSGHLKERLSHFFKEVVFLPGKEIITEGNAPSCAYLIKEGTCTIMSRQNPIYHPAIEKYIKVPPDPKVTTTPACGSVYKAVNTVLSPAKTHRGYMSLSTNIYQLRTISEREWFGEETLLMDEMPTFKYEYSVLARTKVIALEISRENMKKFPRDLLEWFKGNAYNKTAWHNERKIELAESIGKIYHMDPMKNFLDEALLQVTKKFPQASPSLTTQIHKYNFLSQEDMSEISDIKEPEDVDILPSPQMRQTQRLMRPKSGIMPTFNNLRMLMSTNKKSVQSGQRPMTAAQTMTKFNKTSKQGQTAKYPCGYKSSADFFRGTQTQKFQQTAPTLFHGFQQADTEKPVIKGKIPLEAAATFRMTFKNTASIPTFPKKRTIIHKTLSTVPKEHKHPLDAKVQRMKIEVENMYNTFKVGIRDIEAIEPDSSKRPPSPNPVKIWAAKNRVDIIKRNEEIKQRLQPAEPISP